MQNKIMHQGYHQMKDKQFFLPDRKIQVRKLLVSTDLCHPCDVFVSYEGVGLGSGGQGSGHLREERAAGEILPRGEGQG